MKKVIVISGKQGSGKSTLAKMLQNHFDLLDYSTQVLKFADTLYAMHDACLPILKAHGIRPESMEKDGELLQILGTEYGRKLLGEDVWAKALMKRLKDFQEITRNSLAFVDDCRFPNEFDILKDQAVLIRLNCSTEVRKERCSYWREKIHESEIALDEYAEQGKFDIYIDTENNNINEAFFDLLEKLR